MPRGGARIGSGPPPDLNALKRVRDGKEWVRLPQKGISARSVPRWPAHMPEHVGLPDPRPPRAGASPEQLEAYEEKLAAADRSRTEAMEFNERELDYWRQLWTKQPQAHVWRADGTEDVVALFVRTSIEATQPGSTVGARTLVKQLSQDLLLNTAALHSARYIIDRTMKGSPAMPDPSRPQQPARAARPARSIRDGLHVVPSPADDDDTD